MFFIILGYFMKKLFFISVAFIATTQLLQAGDQSTSGNKSSIITGTHGSVIVYYNETKNYYNGNDSSFDVFLKKNDPIKYNNSVSNNISASPVYKEKKLFVSVGNKKLTKTIKVYQPPISRQKLKHEIEEKKLSFSHKHGTPPCMGGEPLKHHHKGLANHTHKYSCVSR